MAGCTFLGLGVMGFPMAGHLQAAGHDVTVWHRTAAKAQAWAEQHGGKYSDTVEAAVGDADVVMMCLGDDPDVRAIAEQAIPAMKPGAILIDHTTASAELARELDTDARDAGVGFIDAPVSGGQAGAESGQLTIMCGGEADTFARAEPVMNAYAKAMSLIGPAGSGQLAKMVNQICIAGLVQGLSEGLNFAMAADLDTDALLEAISGGAAQSWQMVNRGQTMVEDKFDFGFAVDWMRKDLRICLEEAGRNGAPLPVTELVAGYYDELSAAGGGRSARRPPRDRRTVVARRRRTTTRVPCRRAGRASPSPRPPAQSPAWARPAAARAAEP